jgi:hypothetical protein
MKKILLLLLVLDTFIYAEFVKATNVVTDTVRNLQWQDNEVSSSITTALWEDAIDICEALDVNDEEDWRLPNIRELQSLVDKTRIAPAISTVFLGTGQSIVYWSSSTYIKTKTKAWTVEFARGSTGFISKIDDDDNNDNNDNYKRNIRCVRDYN